MIPFNKPTFLGEELVYLQKLLCVDERLGGDSFRKISGDGFYTKECNRLLEEYLDASKVLLTHSCTAALEMSALLIGLEKGDEVICPSFTFSTTITSFVLRGAVPVFVDIREDSLNIDEEKIEAAITEKTKAISVVHYAGVPCEMDAIQAIAKKYGLFIIEDAAQAVGSSYKGRLCGTLGDFGCFSFHETKNIVCGEGGALVINNESFIERAEIIREKGTNRAKFFRGQVDKYTWVDIGSSYLPSEMNAAYLCPQIKKIDHINHKRLAIWKQYYDYFKKYEEKKMVRLPIIPEGCQHNAHMFYILFESLEIRSKYISYMKSQGILTVFHYLPLHSSPAGKLYGILSGSMKNTDALSERLVRLPLYYNLKEADLEKVIFQTIKFLGSMV